jgi:signal transduction histidine kinase
MPTFNFEPSARLQKFLGEELIADPNIALAEFVKNAYDAGASQVYIDFGLAGDRGDHTITVSDDGIGMDESEFDKNWMRPGYSYKAEPQNRTKMRGQRQAVQRQRSRVPIGEKGLGRLGAGRLGTQLEVFTRKSRQDPWLHVVFDWARFADMNIALSDVGVPFDFASEPTESRFQTGTVLLVRGLRINWLSRIPGRKVPGRSDTRLGRLRQDLSLLMQPIAMEEFRIVTSVDIPGVSGTGVVESPVPSFRDYEFDFAMNEDSRGVLVRRTIKRSARIAKETGLPRSETKTERVKEAASSTSLAARPLSLRSGPFRGTFFYSPPQVAGRSEALGLPAGVLLYRDGARVEPYGSPDDDWLEAKARKASRQGYAIQPNQLTGFVSISRLSNPDLVDMSNRQGLVENEAFEDLLAHARAELRLFGEAVLDEYVRPGWVDPRQRAQRQAERAQAYGAALVRSRTHSLRQPVSGLGLEVQALGDIADGLVDGELKVRISGIYRRATNHLRRIDEILEDLMESSREPIAASITEFELVDAVRETIDASQAYASTLAVPLQTAEMTAGRVLFDWRTVTTAVGEILGNAIQAAAQSPTNTGHVEIAVCADADDDGFMTVRISDNGPGVDPSVRDSLFSSTESTAGRPGFGLIRTRELLAVFGGRVRLVSTGASGSVFEVQLPTRGSVTRDR